MTEYCWRKCGTEWVFCDKECDTCTRVFWTASNRTGGTMQLIDADAYAYPGDLIDEPTIEAEPVKRGRWVMTLYTTTSKRGRVISNKKFACSECGYSNGRKQSNYCPNCGAKMDLEG